MSSAARTLEVTRSFTRLPRHVGIIPDGNRRWADARGLPRGEGYLPGVDAALRIFRGLGSLGVEEVSVYGFTQENVHRPKEQRAAFQAACVRAVERLSRLDAELRVVGDSRSPMFPSDLLPYVERTRFGKGGIKVNLLINYSWRWDVEELQTTGRLGSHDVTPIDMIIRWGGRCRLSGFLPIQSVYADICVLEELWPDGSEKDLCEALEWYQAQDPTRGG